MNKKEVKRNKPVYLGLLILDMQKIIMYEYLYDYTKPKYGDKTKLCYVYMNGVIFKVKSEIISADLAGDVKKWFDTSNYEINRPLPTRKNKDKVRLMKDELGR